MPKGQKKIRHDILSQIDEIRVLFENGVSIRKLAVRYSTNVSTLSKYLSNIGVNTDKPSFFKLKENESIVKNIEQKYLSGEMIRTLARKYNLSESLLRLYLQKRGIWKNRRRKVTDAEIDDLATKYDTNVISEKLGVSKETVIANMKRRGIRVYRSCIDNEIFLEKNFDEIRDLYYIQRISLDEIGRKFKLSDDTIIRFLRKKGLKIRNFYERTSIEHIMEECLIKLDIPYISQYRYGKWRFDFFIESFKTIIECDGDFWHANPMFYDRNNLKYPVQCERVENDKKKNEFVKSKGFEMMRFWEYDIMNNFENIEKELMLKFNRNWL